jgi:hypothetical protein
MIGLLKMSLLALACSLAVAEFGTLYACIGTCTDGTRMVPAGNDRAAGCRLSDQCSIALPHCRVDFAKVTYDRVAFHPSDYNDDPVQAQANCEKYLKDVLNNKEENEAATADDQEKAGCSCKEIVKFMFEQVIDNTLTDTEGACNAVYEASKDKVTDSICSKKGGWLTTNLCGAVIDTALTAPGYAFKPLCRSFLTAINRETGVDIQTIFANVQENIGNKVNDKVNEFAEVACGSQICTGQSNACEATTAAAGGVLKLVASVFTDCSAANLVTWTTVTVSILSVSALSWGLW